MRVRTFPGLWIDVAALLAQDPRVLAVLGQGLATPEHAAFVRAMAEEFGRKRKKQRRRRGPRNGQDGDSE